MKNIFNPDLRKTDKTDIFFCFDEQVQFCTGQTISRRFLEWELKPME